MPSPYPADQPRAPVSPPSSASFLVRLTLGVVLVNLFIYLLTGLSVRQSYRQYREQAEITTQNLTQTLESEIAGNIETSAVVLFAVMEEYQRQRATAGGIDEHKLNAYIERLRARLPEIDALRIADARGMLIYGTDVQANAKINLADRPHFLRLRDDPASGLVISQPQQSRVNHKWVIVLARRMQQADGTFGGMVFATIALDHLAKTFSALNVGPRGVVALRDDQLALIVRQPEHHGIGSSVGNKAISQAFRDTVAARPASGTLIARSSLDDVERTYAYRRVGNHPLYIIVGLAGADYLAEWRNEATNSGALVALFTLLTLAAAGIVYRTWKRQRDSVAALARQEEKSHTLAQEKEQYWRFFQLATDAMCIADPFGCFKQVNPAFVNLTGYSESELVSQPFLDFVLPEDRQPTAREMELQVTQRPSLRFDNRYVRKDGAVIHLSWTAYFDKNDGVTYASARDVTALRQAEEAVQETRSLLDEVQAMSKMGGWRYECQTQRMTWTEEVYRIYGVGPDYDPNDVESDIQFFSSGDADIIRGAFERAVNAGIPYDLELRLKRLSGERIWVRTTGIPRMIAGKVFSVTGYIIDITERKTAEEQLRIAATAFEAQEGMMITDADKTILRVNRAFSEITGYSAAEIVGKRPDILKSGRHDANFYTQMWQRIRDQGVWQGEIWNRRKDGKAYAEWLTVTAVKGDAKEVTHYVGTLTDITLRKAAEDEIKHLAFYDPLTRLPNRRLLLDRLHQALASSARSGRKGALLFIDLDNFKTLNDTLGHDKGDLLLQQVAQRLSTCIREGDTVARLGGDEFVVMLEDLSNLPQEAASQTKTVGEKVLLSLNQPYLLAGHRHHSTPSIGVTLFDDHGNSVEDLLKRADLAMYRAKAAGRNTLRFFDPEMQASVTARATLEEELRQGLSQDEFVVYYQSQVDEHGRVTGAEALLRWQHPRFGLMLPEDFIPLAEETGLMLPLGQWLLQTACARLAAWAARPELAHLSLALNVSPRQFHHPQFVDQVLAALDRSGADPHKLALELTEALLLDDAEGIIAKMTALKAKGIVFSLDDFGTGYSSLSYLKRLPLDQLKIDQSFVRDILTDSNDAAIARTIVALAQSMGLGVIAEGVETEQQRDFLAQQSCHAFQGYLFGLPLPVEEFESAMNRR